MSSKTLPGGNVTSFAGSLVMLLGIHSAAAGPLSIVNPGFETGSAPALGASGWTITSGGTDWFTTTAGAPDSPVDPDAAAEGLQWLSGNRLATGAGSSSNPQTLEQLIDISGDATLIDSGIAGVHLDFQFADNDGLDDGTVNIHFYSDVGGASPTGSSLTTSVIDETGGGGGSAAVWAARSLVGAVPAGARSLRIEFRIDRNGGTAGNVHFDDLSGVISDDPLFSPGDLVAGTLILANDNAGQCWYQDERITYDPIGQSLHMSTTADAAGFAGSSRDADVDHVSLDVMSRERTRFAVGNMPLAYGADDHNMGAIWTRPDGRYLHVWAGHNGDHNTYYRVSSNPHDPTAWGPEQSYNWETISGMTSSRKFTYSNVLFLSAERGGLGRLYNFGRGDQNSPNISYSDDWGATWHYAGKLTTWNGTSPSSYSNGYFKYHSNGSNRVDFVTTEHHPRNWNNSIYHGYIMGGKSYNSYGVVIDDDIYDETAPDPKDFTPVFVTSTNFTDHHHHAWTTELERAPNGDLVTLYTTRFGTASVNGETGDADLRIFYARFDGATWTSTELSKMGTGLYGSEQDYTGLGTIQPDDPNVVFISTPFDPRDDSELANHEIFKGMTSDDGATWSWTPITTDSTVDNFRPVIAKWDASHTAVFWLRGRYFTSQNYDQSLVGIIERADETVGAVTYIDATSANTTEADGSPLTTTGPTGGNGADDDLWHEYSAVGNGGSSLSCNESGIESTPALKTSVTGLADGTYDVFAYFWSKPGADWRLAAGFGETQTLVFRRYSSQQAEPAQFDAAVTTLQGDMALYRAYVGRRAVSGGQSIDVFVAGVQDSVGDGSERTVYDGVGVAPVAEPLIIAEGASVTLEDTTRHYSAIHNEGELYATQGALQIAGVVTNNGILFLAGDAEFNVGGTMVNNGVLDIINWTGTLPAGFINNGTLLDDSVLEIVSLTLSAQDVTATLEGYAGHAYQLWHTSGLGGGWSTIGSAVPVAGTVGDSRPLPLTHVDALPGDPESFYRFSVESLY